METVKVNKYDLEQLVSVAVYNKRATIPEGYCVPAVEGEQRTCANYNHDCDACRQGWFKKYESQLMKMVGLE